MNDDARELLVAAALRGHKQTRGNFHALGGGECALGVLHLTFHRTRRAAVRCWLRGEAFDHPWEEKFGLTTAGRADLIRRNAAGEDFFTIALEAGQEAAHLPATLWGLTRAQLWRQVHNSTS